MDDRKFGVHYIVDLINTKCEPFLLENEDYMENWLVNVVKASGLTPLNSSFTSFGKGFGYTGFITLCESHISAHSWTKDSDNVSKVNADIFVCNYSRDNSDKAKFIVDKIREIFEAEIEKIQVIERY